MRRAGPGAQGPGSRPAQELAAAEPLRRYQWAQPGDMIHIDTKQLARFERVGHRITGDCRQSSSRDTFSNISLDLQV